MAFFKLSKSRISPMIERIPFSTEAASKRFGFGENYFNKVSLSSCISGYDMNCVNILDNEVLISSNIKYPKSEATRKFALENNLILTTESAI